MKSSEKVAGITISSPEKIIYKKGKITKLDVVNYYNQVAPFMMPYLHKRLLSVIRCHEGVGKTCFFKKHPTTENKYVEEFFVKDEEYFYLKNAKQVVYQSQMGTLEFHTWASKVTKIDKPDIMTFDLDPDKGLSLEALRQGVKHLKSILDELNLTSFLKTSGGKGYHILVPFSSSCNWDKFEEFSRQIALVMEERWGHLYTTNIRKKNRQGKIFIDYLRNGKGATCACPYSLRAKEKPSVSMPISWKELDNIAPDEIDIFSALKRIKKVNPWSKFFEIKQKIK